MSRFWRGIAVFGLGRALGTVFGVALKFFIFPYVFPPPAATPRTSAPRRAFCFNASCERWRNIEVQAAHRALHAEQQPIIGMARIVDSVLVDDERADQSTELDERVPVTTIAGKTRRLDCKHGADTAVADRREQPLEAGTRDAAARAAEVVVDDIDVAPAKLLSAIDEAVLAPPALMIVREAGLLSIAGCRRRPCGRDAQP